MVKKQWRNGKRHKTTVIVKNSYQCFLIVRYKYHTECPRDWIGASAMRSWWLAASALTRPFRNGKVESVLSGHFCPAFARTLERHFSNKTRNGDILKQEPNCSEPQQQARHDNSSDFETQARSCTCFLSSPNRPQHKWKQKPSKFSDWCCS
jgi:hypothetical protein